MKRVIPMHRQVYSEKSLKCPLVAGFDFETDGLGGPFLGGSIWTVDGQTSLFTSLAELFDWMLSHPQYLYLAHNAVGYEFAYLAPLVYNLFSNRDDVDISTVVQGDTRLVQFRIEFVDTPEQQEPGQSRGRGRPKSRPAKKLIVLQDTLCLFSMSLAKVAEAFTPELPKLKVIDFEKEAWDIHNPSHVEYVIRDSQIVALAYVRHWQSIVDVFGVPLGVTAGSTALKAFKACIPGGHVYYRVRTEVEEFLRKCYYGGLVLPGHMIGEWGPTGAVDVNGAYAFQMLEHEYPVGMPSLTHLYIHRHLGFYHVIATVPPKVFDTFGFNPVPCRTDRGLCWPTGTFATFITSPEIEYAQEKGCTFEIIEGYVFTRTEPVFRDFIEKCQELELTNGGVYKPSIKQIRNSAYGKFGAKEEHTAIKFSRETLYEANGYIPIADEVGGGFIPYLYTYQEKSDADYMMPHWAAMVTAYERLYLMRFMEEAYKRGARNVYCDTDSIKCDVGVIVGMVGDGFIPIGNRYGQFKVEETCQSFLMLGGKCFYGVTDNPEKPLVKAKGIPKRISKKSILKEHGERQFLDEEFYVKALQGDREELYFINVKSVMSIIKERSSVRPIERKRRITDLNNSYAWTLAQDGRIYPRGY